MRKSHEQTGVLAFASQNISIIITYLWAPKLNLGCQSLHMAHRSRLGRYPSDVLAHITVRDHANIPGSHPIRSQGQHGEPLYRPIRANEPRILEMA